MNLSVELTLPVKFSREAQSQIVGVTAHDHEELVHHGSFFSLALSIFRPASSYKKR
jgi:hypothetical protein